MLQNNRKESGFPKACLPCGRFGHFCTVMEAPRATFLGGRATPKTPVVSSSLSRLQAHQLPALDLPPAYLTLAPRRHFQMACPFLLLGIPWEAPHCPGRNPKLLGLELQAPPAPSPPVPLGLTHICTHTCIPPTVTHTHHPHSYTYIHSIIHAHILTHTCTHTFVYIHTHVLTPPHILTHSYRCTHMHSFPPYHWGTLTHKHTCALTYITYICALT